MADISGAGAAEKGVGGAAGFVTKRIGPLPLWAWAAGVGVAFLALKAVGRGGSPKAAVTGAGVAVAPGAPVYASPGAANGGGSFAAPVAPVAPTIVNVVIPGYSQPNAVVGTPGAGVPSKPGAVVVAGVADTTKVVTTTPVTAPSSNVGSTPFTRTTAAPSGPGSSFLDPAGNRQASNLPGGAAVQVVNGTQYSLSDAAVARGTPQATVRGSNVGATGSAATGSAVITNGTMPFYTNASGALTQGIDPNRD